MSERGTGTGGWAVPCHQKTLPPPPPPLLASCMLPTHRRARRAGRAAPARPPGPAPPGPRPRRPRPAGTPGRPPRRTAGAGGGWPAGVGSGQALRPGASWVGGREERVGETAEGVGGVGGSRAHSPAPHSTHHRAQTTQHAHTWRRTQAASPPPARVAASASGDDGGGMSGCFDGERAVRGGVLVVVVAEGGAKPSRPDRPGVGGAARLGGRAGRAGGPVACGDGAGRASRICVFRGLFSRSLGGWGGITRTCACSEGRRGAEGGGGGGSGCERGLAWAGVGVVQGTPFCVCCAVPKRAEETTPTIRFLQVRANDGRGRVV